MANRDLSLDSVIIESAKKEFLDKGFEKASMRKIAAAAGVTIGAIYTRYSTKDELFGSLVRPLISKVSDAFVFIKTDYYGGIENYSPELMFGSMRSEADAILHLLYDDYDSALLLLCRSGGSSFENFPDTVIQRKIKETLKFFSMTGAVSPDENVVRLIITSQFGMCFHLIDEGFGLEESKKIMDSLMRYNTGGWRELLSAPSADGHKNNQGD